MKQQLFSILVLLVTARSIVGAPVVEASESESEAADFPDEHAVERRAILPSKFY